LKTASVTGASGVIGRHLIRLLSATGLHVRALARKKRPNNDSVQYITGDISERQSLERLVKGAHYLFHCAGERHNADRMHDVNVQGTLNLVSMARESTIEYFCHLSSAGVIGKTRQTVVDEMSECLPQNVYEQTKYESEQVVLSGIDGCRVVILRPTNVVAEDEHGILAPIFHPSVQNRLKLFITGGERSHLVHAENVAAAAIHLMNVETVVPEVYFVSSDHETDTRMHDIASLYSSIRCSGTRNATIRWYLPVFVPYLLRWFAGRGGNKGNLAYSSTKLISTGFEYPVGVTETIHRICSALTTPL